MDWCLENLVKTPKEAMHKVYRVVLFRGFCGPHPFPITDESMIRRKQQVLGQAPSFSTLSPMLGRDGVADPPGL